MNKLTQKLPLVGGIILICIVLDHVTKYMAVNFLKGQPQTSYFGDTLRILYSENTGAFLGFGSTLPETVRFWIFTMMVAVILFALLGYIMFSPITRTETILYALILGGGFSNLLDRFLNQGVVVDFLNMGIGSLRTGIFNLADVAITTAIILLLLWSFRQPLRSEQAHPPTTEADPLESQPAREPVEDELASSEASEALEAEPAELPAWLSDLSESSSDSDTRTNE